MASPRSSYDKERRRGEERSAALLNRLNPSAIAALRAQFDARDNKLERVDFVALVMGHLQRVEEQEAAAKQAGSEAGTPSPKRSTPVESMFPRSAHGSPTHPGPPPFPSTPPPPASVAADPEAVALELVRNLNEMFREVDVMGDGVATWEQFARFVVEKCSSRGDTFSVDAVAEYSRQPLAPVPKARKDPNAVPAADTAIPERVQYLPSIDCVAVAEARSPVVKIVDAQNLWSVGELNAGPKGHKGSIEAMAYIEPDAGNRWRDSSKGPSYLISSGSDSTIALWSLAPGVRQFSMLHRFSTPYSQLSLCYSPTYNLLYSGSAVGMVHTWDLKHGFETSCMTGHTDMVLDMLHVPFIEQLATCSMDHTVRVWDMVSGAPRQVLRGHSKGVVSLTYCEEYKFLISAAYDHEAIIWSPLVPAMLYKLKGHNTPLVGVRHVPSTPEVVTASVDGQVKVWDLRTLKCVQTFSDSDDLLSSGCSFAHFDICYPRRQIVTASHHLRVHRQVTDASLKSQTDSTPIAAAAFNPVSLTVIVATGRSVGVWSALTGTLLRRHRDLAPADITALALDGRRRKFYLGCADGSITAFNYGSGAPMKAMVPHGLEVTGLAFCRRGRLLSSSLDRAIVVHNDTTGGEGDEYRPRGTVFKKMDTARPHRSEVHCCAYSRSAALAASGSADNEARVWETETAKLAAVLPHAGTEVLTVEFLEPHPILLTCDSAGNNHLWGMDVRTGTKYGLLMAWKHDPAAFGEVAPGEEDGKDGGGEGEGKDGGEDARSPPILQTGIPSHVTRASWDAAHSVLYTGDFAGQLIAWDLSKVVALVSGDGGGSTPLRPTSPKAAVQPASPTHAARRADLAPAVMSVVLGGTANVAMKWCLHAHEDAVTAVQVCAPAGSPPFVLTAGYDCVVTAWTLEPKYLGTLCRSIHRGRNPDWNVPLNVAVRAVEEEADARETLAAVRLAAQSLEPPPAASGPDGGVVLEHPVLGRAGLESRWGGKSAPPVAPVPRPAARRPPPPSVFSGTSSTRVGAALAALDELSIRKPAQKPEPKARKPTATRLAFDRVGREAMGVRGSARSTASTTTGKAASSRGGGGVGLPEAPPKPRFNQRTYELASKLEDLLAGECLPSDM